MSEPLLPVPGLTELAEYDDAISDRTGKPTCCGMERKAIVCCVIGSRFLCCILVLGHHTEWNPRLLGFGPGLPMELALIAVWWYAIPFMLQVMYRTSAHAPLAILNTLGETGKAKAKRLVRTMIMDAMLMAFSIWTLIPLQTVVLFQDTMVRNHTGFFTRDPLVCHGTINHDALKLPTDDPDPHVEMCLLFSMVCNAMFFIGLYRCAANLMYLVQAAVSGLFLELTTVMTNHAESSPRKEFDWSSCEAEYTGRCGLASQQMKKERLDGFLDILLVGNFGTIVAGGLMILRQFDKVSIAKGTQWLNDVCLITMNSIMVLVATWTVIRVLQAMAQMHSTGKLIEAAEELFRKRVQSRTMTHLEKQKFDPFINTLRSRRLTVAHVFGFKMTTTTIFRMASGFVAHLGLLMTALKLVDSFLKAKSMQPS